MFVIRRSLNNPLLEPERSHPWEATATFNWCPVPAPGKTIVLYRAVSRAEPARLPPLLSTIALAESQDGLHFTSRRQLIVPEEEWEKYGCEDPRVTKFENNFYIFYTALSTYPFSPDGIKVAVAKTTDFKKIEERHLVTPFNAKAAALFPERIGGKITLILTVDTDRPPAKLAIAQFDREEEMWSSDFWQHWSGQLGQHSLEVRRTENDHVEVGAPPIKTKFGWLLLYSHIQNYFDSSSDHPRTFGVEALLLDLKNPLRIMAKTKGPFLVAEEPYEQNGHVANVVFPSGALVRGDTLDIYYGAADTTGCRASVKLTHLIESLAPETASSRQLARFPQNPIISPNPEHAWESLATFNPGAIELEGEIYVVYRALSGDLTSSLGLAVTADGFRIEERLAEPIYVPREPFEQKKMAGYSGCEDPRLTLFGDTLYMCYTAFDGIGPARVAVTSISVEDFLARRFENWAEPVLITPREVNDKDTCLLSEEVAGKYMLLHRVGTDICADFLDSLNFAKHQISKCIKVLSPRPLMWDGEKVGIAAPPIKTKAGWLLLYHAVSRYHKTYRVGVALLDLADPTVVLARSTDPIFEPIAPYEREGLTANVVFPCGLVEQQGQLYVYYGGADRVVGVATIQLATLLDGLK